MASAVAAAPHEPSRLAAGVLSAAMHLMLLVALIVGVNWQSSQPQAIVVELWDQVAPPPIETQKPEPQPEIKPEPPKPEVKPPEVKPPPKPEPKPEPPP